MAWARSIVSRDGWLEAAERLRSGEWSLLGLWGERDVARMALIEVKTGECRVLGIVCEASHFPSIGRLHPPAIRLERAMHDLLGLEPDGSPDTRPWLRHDGAYRFLPVEGESLHQIPVGPVHAGIIEPGHFRFTANGETVVRLEERLGYVHKGIGALMTGAPIERAATLAARVSGDSTVAFSLAFARAVEDALGLEVPPRGVWLRALAAELERLANHFGDIGAICNDASFGLMQAHCNVLREDVLRAAGIAFGHRLMRDVIVPGGLARDLDAAGQAGIRAALDNIHVRFPALVELYDNTASLQDRTVGTGVVTAALARQYSAGGYVGRASGRAFDARRTPGYPPYDALRFEVPVLDEGDVNARIWIRIREVEQSLSLVNQILDRLPGGSLRVPPGIETGLREGMALVEGFRGDIMVWLRLDGGQIERCHLRDPSWFQWPLLEAAVEDNIVADFPLCNKSFNCSYSGQDL